MIFVSAMRKKPLKKAVAVSHNCSKCFMKTHLAYGMVEYFSIFWIPVFIINKDVMIQCRTCGVKMDLKLLSHESKPKIPKKLFAFKRIWYFYSGILLILALYGMAMIMTYL